MSSQLHSPGKGFVTMVALDLGINMSVLLVSLELLLMVKVLTTQVTKMSCFLQMMLVNVLFQACLSLVRLATV